MFDDLKKRRVESRSLTLVTDTETPAGRAMWQIIGVWAELERSLISERTRAGVKDAQRREDVAALLNVNRTSLYRRFR